MFSLDHIFGIGGAQRKHGEDGVQIFTGAQEGGHVPVGVQPGLFPKTAHELGLIDQDDPSAAAKFCEKMAHEGKVIHTVLGFAEGYGIFGCFIENPLIDALHDGISDEIALQVGLELELFLLIFRVQIGAQEVVQLVGLQALGGVEEKFVCGRASRRHLIQQMEEAGLISHGQVGAADDFLVHEMQLVHGSLFAQGEEGDGHAVGVGHVENCVQDVGFALAVFAGNYHAVGDAGFGGVFQTAGNLFHELRPGVGKILTDGAGGDSGAQGFDNVSCFHIKHFFHLRPLPL